MRGILITTMSCRVRRVLYQGDGSARAHRTLGRRLLALARHSVGRDGISERHRRPAAEAAVGAGVDIEGVQPLALPADPVSRHPDLGEVAQWPQLLRGPAHLLRRVCLAPRGRSLWRRGSCSIRCRVLPRLSAVDPRDEADPVLAEGLDDNLDLARVPLLAALIREECLA